MTQALPALDQYCDVELDDITLSGSKYTNNQRLHAALVFMSFGNIFKASQALNIPQRTLYDWSKTDWWQKLITRLREEKRHEFDAGFTRIIDKCMNNIEKKLEAGDVSARDSATIMGITFDKRQVLNMQPTSITKSLNIKEMHDQFQRFMQAKTIDSNLLDDNSAD